MCDYLSYYPCLILLISPSLIHYHYIFILYICYFTYLYFYTTLCISYYSSYVMFIIWYLVYLFLFACYCVLMLINQVFQCFYLIFLRFEFNWLLPDFNIQILIFLPESFVLRFCFLEDPHLLIVRTCPFCILQSFWNSKFFLLVKLFNIIVCVR